MLTETLEGYPELGILPSVQYGRVRSVDRVVTFSDGRMRKFKGRVRKLQVDKTTGYEHVGLCSDDGQNTKKIHRLVLETFKPHVNMNDLQVNHIDGDKLNNHLTNLEWVTARDNILHAHDTGLADYRGEGNPNVKLSSADVLEILQRLDTGELPRDIGLDYGVSKSCIAHINAGITWRSVREEHERTKKQFLNDVQDYVERFGREANILFDIEVYPHDSFIVLKDINKNTVAYFHNSTGFGGLMEYVQNGILCGYNNYYYDDYVISAMLSHIPEQGNTNIKRVNDQIILGDGAEILMNSHIISIDCYQQIDVSRPSLKKIEANKGIDIEETPVDFNIDRPLTEKELEDSIFYCSYDVDQTIDIFIERFYGYFKPKQYVVGLLEKPSKKAYRWNTTTISANVVKPDFKQGTRHHQIQVPEEILSLVPNEVVDMWKTQDKGKIKIEAFNNIVEFGFGGLHSTHKDKKVFDNVVVADFESLYPNIMINHNLLGEYTENLKQLVKRRVEAKHQMAVLKNLDNRTPEQENEMNLLDQEQGALKLVINSVYGLLKNKYSSLFDPKISTTVCAIGQCYLFELANRLSSCATIQQNNTDGTFFVPHDDRYKQICEEFAEEVNIKLDYDDFDKVIQKSVNDYIAISPDESLYLKGGDTNLYHKPNYYGTNTARICQIALVNYLAYDKPVLDTILEHRDDPSLFQYVLQAGNTYKGTFDQHDKQYQKVNRVFATHLPNHVTLKKKRSDDGLVSFANAPEKMFVWNKDISELDGFEHIVDVGHYVKIVNRMIELWEKPLA